MSYFPLRVSVISLVLCLSVPALAVTLSPSLASLKENATQQFTASTASTWSTNCGSISTTGLFKAPLYPSTTCTVTAKATNGSGSATAKVTVTSPITMTPTSAKTPQGKVHALRMLTTFKGVDELTRQALLSDPDARVRQQAIFNLSSSATCLLRTLLYCFNAWRLRAIFWRMQRLQ